MRLDLPTWLIIAGYASAALTFAAVALALRPARVGTAAPRLRLRVAALATACWAALSLWLAVGTNASADAAGIGLIQLVELAFIALWLWQLESFAQWQGQSAALRRALRFGPLVVVVAAALAVALETAGVVTGSIHRGLSVAALLLAVFGFFALEQIYRNASSAALPSLRWFCLGVGGLFLVELITFAEWLLFGGVPLSLWVARGAFVALCGAALWQGARRMPDWSLGLALSRRATLYTTSVVGVGLYLVLLSIGGVWLARLPAQTAAIAQWLLWAAGVAGLGFMIFSNSLRRRMRVLVAANFYPHRYDYRLEWLRFIRTLAAQDAALPLPQCAIRAVAQIIESPRGVLWRRQGSDGGFEPVASWPQEGSQVASARRPAIEADDPLVRFLERKGWLVDLREWRADARLYEDLDLIIGRYAEDPDALIVPLLCGEELYGWLVLDRPATLGELTFEDRDLLKTAGRQVAVHLSQYDADQKLAEAQQFEAYNRMTAFVMHDLKNIAAQLKLIAQNAERHRRNPEFVDDAMRSVGSAATRMAKLIGQLAAGAQTGELQGGTMQTVDLAAMAERAAVRCGDRSPVPQVQVRARPTAFVDAERLASALEHAIRNAQDATPEDGEVIVEVSVREGHPRLAVIDNGCGMDETFIRERLFRPFDTTKGTRGMGIGAFQIREYLRALGGSVEVESHPGRGTRFTMLFPPQAIAAPALKAG